MKACLLIAALWAGLSHGAIAATDDGKHASAPAIDDASGLIKADGWELVQAHCGACHSYGLITAQRGDANFWRDAIRWMQRTQNLWEIPPDQENAIVNYLGSQYNETDWGRRPALSPTLLPTQN